ncbi:unnamed protein product [Soboliphyme baturini]|uniref:XPGN domain-containing protein n=1 Tax=Soboliphyme baturini TaxID=241478 RepID=A0A183J1M8_9BILA|nr:unnamed protein product [Soboliphyme baturini]
MGVKGLWKLLEPTACVTNLDALSGQILAVDLSMWLHQAIHGKAGLPNDQNTYLDVLLRRLLKMMFYGIRPVIVFDGANVPAFKEATMAKRKLKRSIAAEKLRRIQPKLLRKLAEKTASATCTLGASDGVHVTNSERECESFLEEVAGARCEVSIAESIILMDDFIAHVRADLKSEKA